MASGLPTDTAAGKIIEAIEFLRRLNAEVYEHYPRRRKPSPKNPPTGRWCRGPIHVGGLGFGLKWDMGWMHDTLEYMRKDPVHRRFHHEQSDLSHDLRLS